MDICMVKRNYSFLSVLILMVLPYNKPPCTKAYNVLSRYCHYWLLSVQMVLIFLRIRNLIPSFLFDTTKINCTSCLVNHFARMSTEKDHMIKTILIRIDKCQRAAIFASLWGSLSKVAVVVLYSLLG